MYTCSYVIGYKQILCHVHRVGIVMPVINCIIAINSLLMFGARTVDTIFVERYIHRDTRHLV